MLSKPKRKSVENDEICEQSVKDFLMFYKIDMKSDKEVSNMTKVKRRQYESRLQRWNSLIQTHIEYEIFKSLSMFRNLHLMIEKTKQRISEIREEPDFETAYDADYKKDLKRTESETHEMLKQLTSDRQAFDEIYIPYKKRKAEELLEIKEEIKECEADIKSEVDSDVEIKDEYFSEESNDYYSVKDEDSADDKKAVKKEIEFDVKPKIKREIKSEIKYEVKSEVKSEIKEEFKVEVKDETTEPKIKEEIISSEDDE